MLWLGVDIFFVLSGFLITGILLDLRSKDLGKYFSHFYSRRARRILPPYVLLLLIATPIFGASWMAHWYLYLGAMNYQLGFHFPPEYGAFSQLWSLGVEEQFYLLWPFAVYFVSEKKLPYLAAGLMVAAPVIRALLVPIDTNHWMDYQTMYCRMDCLAMGTLLTFLWRSRHRETLKKYGYLALLPTLFTPVLMLYLAKHYYGYSTMDGTLRGSVVTIEIALVAAAGTVIWALGGRFTGILTAAPMRWLGKISYSFYLIHMSCIMIAQKYIHSVWLAAACAAAASIIYSALSWHFMESPILNAGNKKVAQIELSAATNGPVSDP